MTKSVSSPKKISKINFNESQKITDTLIKRLKPKSQAYFITDTDLTGFWLRVPRDTSETTYLVSTKPRGGRNVVRRTIGKASLFRSTEAREIARKWLQEIKSGKDPKAEEKRQKAKSKTLHEAFTQYIEDRVLVGKLGKTSVLNYQYDMKNRLSKLMNKKINSLNEESIKNWYKQNSSESKAQTDRAYRELNAVLNYQVALKHIENNPASIVKTLGIRTIVKPRESFLSIEEIGNLINELPSYRLKSLHNVKNSNLMIFTLLTGLRESSVYNLKWSQVKFRDLINIEKTKNGDNYILPLTPLLNDLLEQQREIVEGSVNPMCEFVFPNINFSGPVIDPKKSLNTLYRSANISKNHSDHDLRRTFASLADLAGISFTDIKHLMIHRKNDVTERYMQSQQLKAQENYQRVIEMLCSITPIAFYSNEKGDSVTHYTTPQLLRFTLFNKGPLSKHPDRDIPDFQIDQSIAFYNQEKAFDWD